MLAALKALYFKGAWATPFKVSETQPADFHTMDGGRVRTPFMHSGALPVAQREEGRFVAVDMPFAGGRYSMVVMTTKDAPTGLASFADHLEWLDGRGFHTVKLDVDEEGATVVAVTDGYEAQGGVAYSDVSEVMVDKPFAFALRDGQTGSMVAAGFVSQVDGERLAVQVPSMPAHLKAVMTAEDQRASEEAERRATALSIAARERQHSSPALSPAQEKAMRDF